MSINPSIVVAFTLILASAAVQSTEVSSPRLYVLDCGSLVFNDVSAFGLSNSETEVREMVVPCYLIRHGKSLLLWDAGLDPLIAGQGAVTLQPGAEMTYVTSVVDQLAMIGVTPQDVDLIALSHMHFDHTGAANYFPNAKLLIQQTEYQAAFVEHEKNPVFDYKSYSKLADQPIKQLDGDYDVFGDGSVKILSAPGHTPGHQVLFVRLKSTGPVILGGDLYHFRFSRAHRRIPIFNTSPEETLASMERIETLTTELGATFWIEHDRALVRTLNFAPSYYE